MAHKTKQLMQLVINQNLKVSILHVDGGQLLVLSDGLQGQPGGFHMALGQDDVTVQGWEVYN